MKRIWMVNSDPVVLAGMNIAVQSLNTEAVLYSNPVAFLRAISAGVKPNAIILDYRLAGVDTMDVLRVLRNHPIFRFTPCIVILDTDDSEELRKQVMKAGAAGILRRDVTARKFKALVNECLREASISQLSRCVAEYAA